MKYSTSTIQFIKIHEASRKRQSAGDMLSGLEPLADVVVIVDILSQC